MLNCYQYSYKNYKLLQSKTNINSYVTESGKAGLICTTAEFHFLSVRERCTLAHGQVCFYKSLFADAVKPRGFIPRLCMRDINRTSWGTKLLLTTVLATLCSVSVDVIC